MKECTLRSVLIVFVLIMFGCILFMQEQPEEVSVESIPLEIYDLIVQEHPNASPIEIVQIYLDDKELYNAFLSDEDH